MSCETLSAGDVLESTTLHFLLCTMEAGARTCSTAYHRKYNRIITYIKMLYYMYFIKKSVVNCDRFIYHIYDLYVMRKTNIGIIN